MRRARDASILLAMLGATLPSGCTAHDQGQPPLEADSTHMFGVEAGLRTTSCGDGLLAAPTEWLFDVRFERHGRQVHWNNGRHSVIGTLDEDGQTFAFDNRAEIDLSEAGYGPCAVRRRDQATGTLDIEQGILVGFRGELAYVYEPVDDTGCQLLVGAPGGLAALPCVIRYEMQGARWP